jgi:hypothetical protein
LSRPALGEDTLQRCRRVFGADDPITLSTATALTAALLLLGETKSAQALAEDTLQRSRRSLGPDHATTLFAAATLTLALFVVGEEERAPWAGTRCSAVRGCSALTTSPRRGLPPP